MGTRPSPLIPPPGAHHHFSHRAYSGSAGKLPYIPARSVLRMMSPVVSSAVTARLGIRRDQPATRGAVASGVSLLASSLALDPGCSASSIAFASLPSGTDDTAGTRGFRAFGSGAVCCWAARTVSTREGGESAGNSARWVRASRVRASPTLTTAHELPTIKARYKLDT